MFTALSISGCISLLEFPHVNVLSLSDFLQAPEQSYYTKEKLLNDMTHFQVCVKLPKDAADYAVWGKTNFSFGLLFKRLYFCSLTVSSYILL